jgi:hypothetical protein
MVHILPPVPPSERETESRQATAAEAFALLAEIAENPEAVPLDRVKACLAKHAARAKYEWEA